MNRLHGTKVMSILGIAFLFMGLLLGSISVKSAEVSYSAIDVWLGEFQERGCASSEAKSVLSIVAAIDELESASFLLCNNSNKPLSVEYKGLFLDGKARDEEHSVEVRYVKRWYQAGGAWDEHWRRKGEGKLVPELLVKDPYLVKLDHKNKKNYVKVWNPPSFKYIDVSDKNFKKNKVSPNRVDFFVKDAENLVAIDIPPAASQQYWVTLDAAVFSKGVHKGVLKFSVNEKVFSLPVEIVVLPFELVKSKIVHSIYYRGVLDPNGEGSISSERKSAQQLKADFENLKSHGIKNPTVYQPIRARKKWSEYSNIQLKNSLSNYFQIRADAGFANDNLYYAGATTGRAVSDKAILSVINTYSDIARVAENFGFKQVYIYGSDEAKGDKLLSQKKVWSALKDIGGKVFVAGSTGHVELMGKETDLLVYRDEVLSSDLFLMHEQGNKIFKYHDPKSGPENPALFRYKRGLYLWQKGYDGAMDYAYQHSMGFIWNDFDHARYRDLAFTYPTVNGVIDTIAWEGYREGIDDLNYLATLEFLIEKAEQSLDPGPKVVDEAKRYLVDLKSAEMIDLNSVRETMIAYITKLLNWVS